MLDEFIAYLVGQIGQPYVWGGQHTRLTPDNYIRVIEKKEAGRGGYPGGPSYAQAAEDFCKAKFDAGATVLFAYDCSGLGVYWLCNVKHLYKTDVNANTMMGRCAELTRSGHPEKGWWVFRQDSTGKATHIGYMVDNKYLVEAKGRKYGVTRSAFKTKDWSIWGIPAVFYDEIKYRPEPAPVPDKSVKVLGRSVNVRYSDSKAGKMLFVAHRGDTFPYLGPAPSGWYEILTARGNGFITNLPKYTRLV